VSALKGLSHSNYLIYLAVCNCELVKPAWVWLVKNANPVDLFRSVAVVSDVFFSYHAAKLINISTSSLKLA